MRKPGPDLFERVGYVMVTRPRTYGLRHMTVQFCNMDML